MEQSRKDSIEKLAARDRALTKAAAEQKTFAEGLEKRRNDAVEKAITAASSAFTTGVGAPLVVLSLMFSSGVVFFCSFAI